MVKSIKFKYDDVGPVLSGSIVGCFECEWFIEVVRIEKCEIFTARCLNADVAGIAGVRFGRINDGNSWFEFGKLFEYSKRIVVAAIVDTDDFDLFEGLR